MATYPKISGNVDGKYDLFQRVTDLGAAVSYDGLSISDSANVSVYQKMVTHSVDGHNEVYTFFVIKNTSTDSGSFLAISDISISQNGASVVWSTDGTVDANAPIEMDYTAYGNATKPFVGIQDESDGTINNSLDFLMYDASAGADTYSTSDYFARFALTEVASEGIVELIDDADSSYASSRVKVYPISLATDLVADGAAGGGIPANSYAVIVMRADASSVTEFNTRDYTMTINHNALDLDGYARPIEVPITLSMENKMNVQMKINGEVVAVNDNSGTYATIMSNVMNYNPDSTSEAVDANGVLLSVGSFDSAIERDKYIAGDEVVVSDYEGRRTAFVSDQISWNDISVVKSSQQLDFTVTGNHTLFDAASLDDFNISDKPELSSSESSLVIPLKQTSVSPYVSTGSFVDVDEAGVSTPNNLSNFDVNDALPTTLQVVAAGDQDTKDTSITFTTVSYPCMTLPSYTLSLSKMSRPNGLNIPEWNVSDTSSSPVVHASDTYFSPTSSGLNTLHEIASNQTIQLSEFSNISFSSTIPFNVRLNSHATSFNPYYNGISEFNGSSSIATGAGFAKMNCTVAVTKYADSSNDNNIATMALGDASIESDDIVGTAISTLSDNYRDYSVLIETSSDKMKTQAERDYLHFDYSQLVAGLGTNGYTSIVSVPTGLINYGSGKVPNHLSGANQLRMITAFYPAAPTLSIGVFDTADKADMSGATLIIPSMHTKFQKLETDSSTRTVANDGVYDWNKDSEDSSEVGLYAMSSTNKVGWDSSTNVVTLKTWEVAAASSHSAGGGVLTVSAPNNLQRGMRLLETASGTPAIPADCIITEINTGTGAVTLSTAIPDAISDGDIIFVDDWVQTGMVVESPTQLVNAEEVYISAMTYNGGTSDGNAYDLSTLEAARDGGAGTINVTLKNKIDDTAANPATTLAYDDGSAVGFTKIKKPYTTFIDMPMGIDHQYIIYDQPLSRCVNGDVVLVKSGSGHTSFGSPDTFLGTEYTVINSPSEQQSGDIVDIINKQPKEWGINDYNGVQLYSKRSMLHPGFTVGNIAKYAQHSNKLEIVNIGLTAGDLVGTTYEREFLVHFGNSGAEDIYLHSASFVEADFVDYNSVDEASVLAQPTGANGVSWYVGVESSTPTSSSYSFPIGVGVDYANATPSTHSTDVPANGDQRLQRYVHEVSGVVSPIVWSGNIIGDENLLRCVFNCESGSGASGVYYKTLKVKYYRDSARVKHYYDTHNSSLVERPFKDKELYEAIFLIAISLDVTAFISVSDADNNNIPFGGSMTITGLVG